jgi:putative phosphoribosyl transferase
VSGHEPHRVSTDEVAIRFDGGRTLNGTLRLPEQATAMVVFAHGSGSSRFSPRNRLVAQTLEHAGLGTLLLDLLEEDEAADRSKVFDIMLLAGRLRAAADWLLARPGTSGCRLGYFGASTGAGAALWAAAAAPENVGAIVARGGRPDLARDVLPRVTTPTLLIVGGDDEIVVELNREAFDLLAGPRELEIIPGATHLFPEPGALEQVAALAKAWFLEYLV